MKVLSKFFAIAMMASFAACSNAPEEAIESSEAEEVKASEEASATYTVAENGESEIRWEGFKTYSDGVHTGSVDVSTGEIMVVDGKVTGGSFVVDMNSITSDDFPANGEFDKTRLEGHLKSEDFFHTQEHPTAKFTITRVEENTGGMKTEKGEEITADQASHKISGNLMMRGKERNITIPANVEVNENEVRIETPEFVIDRTQWEVMALSEGLEGMVKENAISNNLRLKVNLTAEKS